MTTKTHPSGCHCAECAFTQHGPVEFSEMYLTDEAQSWLNDRLERIRPSGPPSPKVCVHPLRRVGKFDLSDAAIEAFRETERAKRGGES